jgi:membrane protein
MLLLAVWSASLLFERAAVRAEILVWASSIAGANGGEVAKTVLTTLSSSGLSAGATVLTVVVAVVGATAAFGQLRAALNIVWDVQPKRTGVSGFLMNRAFAFILMSLLGLLLIASIFLGTSLSAFSGSLASVMPDADAALRLWEALLSLVGGTLVFALVFTVLPERRVDLRDTLVGALVTSVMWTVGKTGLAAYLSSSSIADAFGVLGSFVVLLVWLYYSAQVVLFGAEFTHVWAQHRARIRSA